MHDLSSSDAQECKFSIMRNGVLNDNQTFRDPLRATTSTDQLLKLTDLQRITICDRQHERILRKFKIIPAEELSLDPDYTKRLVNHLHSDQRCLIIILNVIVVSLICFCNRSQGFVKAGDILFDEHDDR